jgi:hypothetical protein
MVGYCECSNELSSSIKSGEFLDQMSSISASKKGLCSMELIRIQLYYGMHRNKVKLYVMGPIK